MDNTDTNDTAPAPGTNDPASGTENAELLVNVCLYCGYTGSPDEWRGHYCPHCGDC